MCKIVHVKITKSEFFLLKNDRLLTSVLKMN